ncbi:PRK06851 family protein [Tepidibacter aestuarii]|uniref:PRK06851 family protein n=1 Tax=Tepidibacter aestuarii TaxID=2925782 RepID=UPI0020BD9B4D|nr:PRK06851 family protein [Tepidibacter aestuarii]CAH2214691.1 conserved protein of unknown function [Tepidibacter aestuarii]
MTAKIKRVFPGGNTADGFFSYYDYMIQQQDANHIFCIKGGPGVGKSSMMKNIGNEMLRLGYDVEFHHCSSDNNSIDGIVIPALKVAMVDGTAPHIVDPKNPGAVDEVINLGEYWDLAKMKENREAILKSNKEVGRLFTRAYKFLKAAECIVKDVAVKYKEAMDFGKINSITLNLIDEILGSVEFKGKAGDERHLFGSAITPNGVVEYTDTIFNDATDVYYIKGDVGTGKSTLLEKVYKNAVLKGLDVEVYHTPLIKDKIETIFIKEMNIALTVSNMFKENNYKVVDLDICVNHDILDKYKDEIEYDKGLIEKLLENGIENIRRAKKEHDVMEKYYIPNMSFDKIEKLKIKIKEQILEFK